jgi:cyanophycinase-like exopeptidase
VLTAKIADYFHTNVGFDIDSISARRISDIDQAVLNEIENAGWIFAGPGSPTYVERIWRESGVDKGLIKMLEHGSLVLASAAAMAIGVKSIPVYEIYKVGTDPYWNLGLDILGAVTGLSAVVVAHYNNTQGGNHDTRFCFIGGKRMSALESMLDPDIGILGIDEHTGLAIDLESKEVEVFGKGQITWRLNGAQQNFASKSTFSILDLV